MPDDQFDSQPDDGTSASGMGLPPSLALAMHRFDAAVDSGFDRLRGNAVADRFFYSASHVGDHGLIWIAGGIATGFTHAAVWRAGLRIVGAEAVQSLVVNQGIKRLFNRARPEQASVGGDAHPHHFRVPQTTSFPSGHASAAFCSATLLADTWRFGSVAYVVALAIAASRVHTRAHHPSDVVAGAIVGMAFGLAIRRIVPLPG